MLESLRIGINDTPDEYYGEYEFGFTEYLGENNQNKQPTLILEKGNDEYNIILNNNNTITISKKDSEENNQQKLIDEIQSKFFQEDKTIKTLFENLEYELTDEQMKSYDKIKELLGYKKISVEQPKVIPVEQPKVTLAEQPNVIPVVQPKVIPVAQSKVISGEQPKVKYSLCGKENNCIGTKSNGSFGCCGW